MAFPDILIGSKFDGKGFKQAETALGKLNKGAVSLGKTLGVSLGTAAVVAFGKVTVKAFMDDQKAAAQLSNTVKNLGLAFANTDIQNFVEKLSLASGVADDDLRPAMQKLLQTTGSVVQSQKLLTTAIDISKGSSTDMATVATDLTNAYVGNNKGLKKYALGLSAAELKTASFDTVLQAFNKNFAGAAQADLKTVAGQLGLITNAAKEGEETIGGGLVDAFKTLTGDTGITNLSVKISELATNIANFFRGLAIGFRDLANMPVIKQLLQLAGIMLKLAGKVAGAVINPFIDAGKASVAKGYGDYAGSTDAATRAKNAAAAAKAEADAKKRAKELLAAQTKNTAELKKQAALKKDGTVFDMEQIQLIAALKGKLSKDEEDRVKLQLALLNENATEADRLTKQVLMAQDATGKLYAYFQQTPDAKNPFAYLDKWIVDFQQKLNALQMPLIATGGGSGALVSNSSGSSYTYVDPASNGGFPNTVLGGITLPATNASNAAPSYPSDNTVSYNKSTGLNYNPNANIIVQIDGKTVATATQSQSLSGIPANVSRVNGMFTG